MRWSRGTEWRGKVGAVDLLARAYDKENELIRTGLVRFLSGAFPLYVVNVRFFEEEIQPNLG
jgi:hypothetical protein